jgi:hypothetical protein
MTEEGNTEMGEDGSSRTLSRQEKLAAIAAAFDDWEDALEDPQFRPEHAGWAGYAEHAHVVDATAEQVDDLERRVREALADASRREPAPATARGPAPSRPTFALRVLERLAAGTMSIDVAVDLFTTHEFARDPSRRRAETAWEGAFEDAEWTFGDAEFDAVTRAFMRHELSSEDFKALTAAAAAPPDADLQPTPPAETLRWDRIVAWRARLADDDVGEMVPPQPAGEGVWTMPFARLSEASRAFVRCLQTEGVVAPFEWPRWMRLRGRELLADPELLHRSSLEDCRRLLAAVVRGDRFSEGAILRALEEGNIDRVLQRIQELTHR